ncbi:MAG: hypothetical protein PHD97_08645 [Bacteroidales bacterium]|nr:hypothetical protein [Bacteroidales bacterium]
MENPITDNAPIYDDLEATAYILQRLPEVMKGATVCGYIFEIIEIKFRFLESDDLLVISRKIEEKPDTTNKKWSSKPFNFNLFFEYFIKESKIAIDKELLRIIVQLEFQYANSIGVVDYNIDENLYEKNN